MKRRYSMAMGFAAAALILTLSACSDDYGFFSTLESETKSTSISTFKKVKITDLVYFNGNYYALANAVYTQSADGVQSSTVGTWALLNPGLGCYSPSTTSTTVNYSCKAIAANSSMIYLSGEKEDASGTTTSYSRDTYYSSDGSTWKSLGALSNLNVQALYTMNDKVFAAVRTDEYTSYSTYTLYCLDGASATAISAIGTSGTLYSLPIAAYMNGEYWFAALASSSDSYTTLYHASNPDFTSCSKNDTSSLGKLVTAMAPFGSSGKGLFGMANGYVYTQDLASFDASWATKTVVNSSYPIQALVALPYGNASPSVVLAGVHYANGYYASAVSSGSLGTFYIQDSSSANLSVSTIANFDSTLDSLLVGKFVYDDTNSRLFACVSATATSVTANYSGLYSNPYSSGAWGGWETE